MSPSAFNNINFKNDSGNYVLPSLLMLTKGSNKKIELSFRGFVPYLTTDCQDFNLTTFIFEII